MTALVKIIRVIQVGNRRYSRPRDAAREYATQAGGRLWTKYRNLERYQGNESDFYWALHERMARRVLPVFTRVLQG